MIGFGDFGNKRKMEITTLADKRLLKIAPSYECEVFINNVYVHGIGDSLRKNPYIQDFLEAVNEVKEAGIPNFWRPIFDPAYCDEKIMFEIGMKPRIKHSFNWWENKIKEIPDVEGKKWELGTEYQYYAFLVYLINKWVEKGNTLDKVLDIVVLDTKEKWEGAESFMTGTREKFYYICGCCDLTKTYKILRATNGNGFWHAGGRRYEGYVNSLANLSFMHEYKKEDEYGGTIGWPVLE